MQTLFNLNQPGFSRFISVSLVVHTVVLAFALFFVKGEPRRVFYAPVTPVELVAPPKSKPRPKPAVKKPKPVKKEALKKAPVKKAKPKPVKKKAVALKKAPPVPVEEKVSIDDALSKLEEKVAKEEEELLLTKRLEELEERAAYEERRKKRELEELKHEIEELEKQINTVSADAKVPKAAGSSDAVSGELFDLEFKAYYGQVGSKIQSLWIYPGEPREGLETLVSIKIDKTGMLMDYWVEKRSGDSLFDESALRAVAKAAPFPPLPEEIDSDFMEIGLRFCPGGCKK